jgi:hypothetical protein
VSKKAKPTPPADRSTVMEQVRALLADHFDCGLSVVSWEEQGTTFHMEVKFGNHYAVRQLARDAEEILFPIEEDEDEEEEEEEQA